MPRIRVAVFPGRGLDEYRFAFVDEEGLADDLATLFGSEALTDECVSPVHALYRPAGSARYANWFVMVREGDAGRLVDIDERDVRELPRMLASRPSLPETPPPLDEFPRFTLEEVQKEEARGLMCSCGKYGEHTKPPE